MAVLSHTAEYAVRAVLYLAQAGRGATPVTDLSRALGIPANYLAKTLSRLARAGILASTRGKHGGFTLAKPATRVTVEAVVAPFDPVGRRHCLLGNRVCSDRTACEAHESWAPVSDRMADFFRTTTIADILDRHERAALVPDRSDDARAAASARGAASP
jgi:Rrf2 family protein